MTDRDELARILTEKDRAGFESWETMNFELADAILSSDWFSRLQGRSPVGGGV